MMSVEKTVDYFKSDFSKSFFPLDVNKIIIENAAISLHKYIYENILDETKKSDHFLPQIRCYPAKHGLHLRRTLKLDPVAEFYIYDLICRNKNTFRKDFANNRLSFGHCFQDGQPTLLSKAYREFKKEIFSASKKYKYALKLDIASYFNSIYHHDIVIWFDNGSRHQQDVEGLGQFLREINSGRSVDCLPQGIHPCKVIGAEFLKFIDNARILKSELILRFMDDICLFSDSKQKIENDFIIIQQLAGEKGLNFNYSKTKQGKAILEDVDNHIEKVRKELLYVKREIIETYYGITEVEVEEELNLNSEQEAYLYSLLKNPNLEEMDAELILTFMREKGEDVLEYLNIFFDKYPNLSKKVFYFCENIQDKSTLAKVIIEHLDKSDILTEEQLFWFAKIAEGYLSETEEYGKILIKLLDHKSATDISKSKVLEIADNRFGLPDLREQYLKVGRADWLSWASAVGTRSMSKNNRNHMLKYFGNVSQMNLLTANAIREF